jgi:hypothetical protein
MEKILSVYLDPHSDHPDVVNRFIFIYKGLNLQIDTDGIKEFIDSLPEFWHTENDKLTLFTVFSDNSYYCERQKNVYNYSTKTFEKIPYRFDAANEEESNKFVAFLAEFFQNKQIQYEKDLQQNILNNIQDFSLIQSTILNTRKEILKQTDYLFLADYSITDERKSAWAEYRQKWRDITKQTEWATGEIHKIKLPISPDEKDGYTYNIMKEIGIKDSVVSNYIDSIQGDEDFEEKMANLVSNYCEFAFKNNVIQCLMRFRLPLIDLENNVFNGFENTMGEFITDWEKFSEKIDNQLKMLGTELSVSSLVSHYKTMNGNALTQEVIDILQDLNNTETEEKE